MFTVFSLLLGMLLGQRFRVLSIVPAIAFLLALSIGMGIAYGWSFATVLLSAGAGILGLQTGYLAGIGIRYVATLPGGSRRILPASMAAPHDYLVTIATKPSNKY